MPQKSPLCGGIHINYVQMRKKNKEKKIMSKKRYKKNKKRYSQQAKRVGTRL